MGFAAAILTAVTALLSSGPATADTRPVNISNAWYLPDMDSSVFLRHFREKVTWPEAESICRQNHGTLAIVEGSRDFDATRSYLLREGAGGSGSVWIGLRRARPGGDFMWINSHPMGMEGGYWLESPPSHSSPPLCVALDPSADFRWRAKGCGPESTATFLCQLPVPLWVGRGEGGCLPSLPPSSAPPMSWLTILYLPDQGALDLTADCVSKGQRQLACKKGTTTGEELGWRLSCTENLRLHLDDHGMRQRRGRPLTYAPPTRHRRDLTGTSMTTTQPSSSPSREPPLPSPVPTLTPPSRPPSALVVANATTSQSPDLPFPSYRPTPTHNLTVSLTVVISPASSDENDTTEGIREFSRTSPDSQPSGEELISITSVSQDVPSLQMESADAPSKPGPRAISIDVLYIEPTATQPPERPSSVPLSTAPLTESSSPESPPPSLLPLADEEGGGSTWPPSSTTQSLQASRVMEADRPPASSPPSPTTASPPPLGRLSLPPRTSPPVPERQHMSLLPTTNVEATTHQPPATPSAEPPASSTADSSAPHTRVDKLKGYTSPGVEDASSPTDLKITLVAVDNLGSRVGMEVKDGIQGKSQNDVLKGGGDDEGGFQWIKIGSDKDTSYQGSQESVIQATELQNKEESTLTLVPLPDGTTIDQRSTNSVSTKEATAAGHVELDGEWTEVGTLDPVSERFLEEREEVDSDLSSPPPRPNRSRKLTRPQGRSFYTYFLSRVLG
ncbi:uncharacterized protein [Hetaerina americana]|uniref:uncharacterized protein n=1 Tax=Hetaerina americana TaxID=62018 RepID=UPI003A7F2F57